MCLNIYSWWWWWLLLFSSPTTLSTDRDISPEPPHDRTLSTNLRQMISGLPDPIPLPYTRIDGTRLDSVGEEESLSLPGDYTEDFAVQTASTKRRRWIKRWRTVDSRAISMGEVGSKIVPSGDYLSNSMTTATLHAANEVRYCKVMSCKVMSCLLYCITLSLYCMQTARDNIACINNVFVYLDACSLPLAQSWFDA